MNAYTCTSDRYDNSPNNRYDSVEDFQAMCEACFGGRVDLYCDGGEWFDRETGEAVLVPVAE